MKLLILSYTDIINITSYFDDLFERHVVLFSSIAHMLKIASYFDKRLLHSRLYVQRKRVREKSTEPDFQIGPSFRINFPPSNTCEKTINYSEFSISRYS